ncbi:membrane protein insertase YidC [Buchnera aphidicola (Formosaphis micheliae)]|uniref:membrane protein insertase YidC n=1 Tax=Buchnera aphidicola TaxID=9 RepID=UPI0031CC3EAE
MFFLIISFLLCQIFQLACAENVTQLHFKQNQFSKLSINTQNNKKIFIKTDTMLLKINKHGGDIEEAYLLTYKDKLNSIKPFRLLQTSSDFSYQAQSGITGINNPDNSRYEIKPWFTSAKSYFQLKNGQNELRVPMLWIDQYGVIYKKTFILTPGSYVVKVEYLIQNKSNKILNLSMFGQLKQTVKLPKNRDVHNNNFLIQNFRGAACSTEYSKYEKYKFNDILNHKNVYTKTKNGWVAMLQQYFVTAWIPCSEGDNIIYTSNLGNGVAAIGYKSHSFRVMPEKKYKISSKLWIGPAIQESMSVLAPNLDLTVDYGFLWFLSQPLFKLLRYFNNILHNWGVAIILITLVMRIIMYPFTKSQYISMVKIRSLQPQINDLKVKFADNKTKLSQEIMSLYKREHINPFSGFFSLLIQMPIFLALYYMLIGSIELRHAPFVLWITDLSAQDPFYVLPIITGITMFYIQRMSPSTISDPVQRNIVNFIPILFSLFFLWFPSGLVLYYIVSNIVTIFQQKIICSKLKKVD